MSRTRSSAQNHALRCNCCFYAQQQPRGSRQLKDYTPIYYPRFCEYTGMIHLNNVCGPSWQPQNALNTSSCLEVFGGVLGYSSVSTVNQTLGII
ncbi:hypothetical protein E1B28_009369 [Marasmius oreades]|uniref:Uncharacterized protein n=1 Tax=Marasmius oreades TaxID=181124 RepID=A0A9P7S1M2_9AGAR|nr:uncharacterized protein E1B28_009369 [Marasmius oreades]KAG7093081.1 hypothetical protein E1B28_009369 [Marasmius oreades]